MLRDNDPDKWTYQEHTRVKHALLEKYLRAWIPILGKRNPTIAYFDGFAGRGEYTDGSPGSPVLALQLADKLADSFGRIVLRFVEQNEDNFANLQSVIEQELAVLKHRQKVDVQMTHGDFDRTIDGLLGFLEEHKASSVPSFFFIDPFGFTGIPLETIGRILQAERTEVFLTLMSRDINRFLGLPELDRTFCSLFGSGGWKPLIKRRDREQALVELYRAQLHEQAHASFSVHFKVCSQDRCGTLYHMLHANNSFKGHHIMKSIMFNQGVDGTFAYLGRDDLAERTQTKLFDTHDTEVLRNELLARFGGQTLGFESIMEKMCYPWYEEQPFIERHYREVIKQLEKDDLVSLERVSSKRTGLKGRDRVTFKEADG